MGQSSDRGESVDGIVVINSARTSAADSSLLARKQGKASITSSVLNLANTIMGTGILALPYALSESGIVLGVIFLFFSTAFGMLSLFLLSEAARATGRPASFFTVCEAAYPRLSVIVDFIVVFNGFLACLSFMIVASDSLSELIVGGPPRQIWTFLSLALVTPLCLLRRLDALKFTSALSFVAIGFISMLIILFALHTGSPLLQACSNTTRPCRGEIEVVGTNGVVILRSFATFVIAFTCQQNIFAVTNELENPTPRRCFTVIFAALGLALLLYLIVGFAGYLTFGSLVDSDVLKSYPQGNVLVAAARAGIATVVITCFPLQAFAVRASLGTLVSSVISRFCGARRDEAGTDENGLATPPGHGDGEEGEPPSTGLSSVLVLEPKALGVILPFLGAVTALALSVTKLGAVIELNGSLAGTGITFIVPGLVYYLLYKEQRGRCLGHMSIFLMGFGAVLSPTSLAVAFAKVNVSAV
jgi:amino acid permease